MQIYEIRDGDINARAGIVIRYRNFLLVQHPTPSSKWPNPLFDLMKGHIQKGETPKDAAIRECYEESGIKFESWKLEKPIQVICDNEPLILFHADLNSPIPVSKLFCTSTFVDGDGVEKPECDGYAWINPYTQIYSVQERLRVGIMYYFNKHRYEEDTQTSASVSGTLPANVGSILSLGYKSGGILPYPKTKGYSKDYHNTIPYL